MSFKTLSELLASHHALTEASTKPEDTEDSPVDNMGGGLGPNPHPVLSRAELVRFSDKLDQARSKLEEVRSIFKHAPGVSGPAHKLHHIGSKAGFDMGAFEDVVAKLDALEEAIDDLHQSWGTQVQQDTGAFDNDEAGPDSHEAEADDLPPDEDEATPARNTTTK